MYTDESFERGQKPSFHAGSHVVNSTVTLLNVYLQSHLWAWGTHSASLMVPVWLALNVDRRLSEGAEPAVECSWLRRKCPLRGMLGRWANKILFFGVLAPGGHTMTWEAREASQSWKLGFGIVVVIMVTNMLTWTRFREWQRWVSLLSYLDTLVGYRAGIGVGWEESHRGHRRWCLLSRSIPHLDAHVFKGIWGTGRCPYVGVGAHIGTLLTQDFRHRLPAGTCPISQAQEESFCVFCSKEQTMNPSLVTDQFWKYLWLRSVLTLFVFWKFKKYLLCNWPVVPRRATLGSSEWPLH